MKNTNKFTLLIVILSLLAITAGLGINYYLRQQQEKQLTQVNATLLTAPKNLRSFTLVNGSSGNFTNKNFKDQWSLVFFGFTHCAMVCPTTLSTLNQAYNTLKNQNYHPLPQVVFVSVDPERDDPLRSSQYATGFNPDFTGLTGSASQIAQLAKDMGAMYLKVDVKPSKPDEKPTYYIDHSTSIMLVGPDGKLHAIFASPESADKFAKDYQIIINKLK